MSAAHLCGRNAQNEDESQQLAQLRCVGTVSKRAIGRPVRAHNTALTRKLGIVELCDYARA